MNIQAACIRFRRWLRIPAKYGGRWNPYPKNDPTIPKPVEYHWPIEWLDKYRE